MFELAARLHDTVPFYAVELFKQAVAMQATGVDIISLGIGEPDFTAAPQVVAAMERAAAHGHSGYSSPAGLQALREAIAGYYETHLGARVDASRIIVTSGASGALLLAALSLINPGDEVMMPDPSYPANRNFISAAGGISRLIATTPESRYQLCAADIDQHWGPATKGILIASPSNPTGTSIDHAALSPLLDAVRTRGGFVMMDEIYLGLTYDQSPRSALALDDNLIILNSFSKYFHMTGWRLGWMIVPSRMVAAIEKLAASLAICAPTLAQHGALACFEPDTLQVFEHRKQAFRQRRDSLVPALESLGIQVPVKPDGAFYVFGDVSAHTSDSSNFSTELLHRAHVAAVPGIDFGTAHASKSMRFAYTTGLNKLEEAVERMRRYLLA